MTPRAPVVRIAHAYGNSRASLRRALAADIDMIEADMWYRSGNLEIRHERRPGCLPLFYDSVMSGHPPGRFALRIGRHFVRPGISSLRLRHVLETVAGKKGLLLDVKGRYDPAGIRSFVETLLRDIRAHRAEAWVTVCGQSYSVLNHLRRSAPDIEVRYSVERARQWESVLRKVRRDPLVRGICISHRFAGPGTIRSIGENGMTAYFWTVDDPGEAKRLVGQGAHGIISNNLDLLASLNLRP